MANEVLHQARRPAANHGGAQAPMLLGIKRQAWLARKLAGRGEIAYWVVSDDGRSPVGKSADLRADPRERNRLRSAKLLDGAYRFICEGRICDRSRNGLRLALARDIALPPQLAVHIDEPSEVRD